MGVGPLWIMIDQMGEVQGSLGARSTTTILTEGYCTLARPLLRISDARMDITYRVSKGMYGRLCGPV